MTHSAVKGSVLLRKVFRYVAVVVKRNSSFAIIGIVVELGMPVLETGESFFVTALTTRVGNRLQVRIFAVMLAMTIAACQIVRL